MAKLDPRSKKIDMLITEMIATDNQKFTMVSDVSFQQLMAIVESRYNLKSKKYYCTDMDSMHSRAERQIKTLIAPEKAGGSLTFTSDCWSGDTES